MSSGFHILTWGSEEHPPIVCLHAERGHARRFERLARMLHDRLRVVAYDLRGHGRSPWLGDQTLPAHASDLEEVMDACGITQATILGDSFGARVGIQFAATHGDRATALVLLDPPLYPLYPTLDELEASGPAGTFASVDDAIEQVRAETGLAHTPRALLEEEMAEHLVADEDGRFRYRYSREAAAAAMEEIAEPESHLGDILCPTMVIHGERSVLLGPADLEMIEDAVRRLRVEEVPGGHVVLWDAFAESSALVRDFLVAKRQTA